MRRAISACPEARTDPDREVESFLDEIDHAVGELDVEAQLRVLRGEVGDRRRDMPLAERDRTGQLKRAARHARARGDAVLGLFEIGEELHGPFEKRLATLGQRKLARRSIQQANAEVGFEVCDMTRYR